MQLAKYRPNYRAMSLATVLRKIDSSGDDDFAIIFSSLALYATLSKYLTLQPNPPPRTPLVFIAFDE